VSFESISSLLTISLSLNPVLIKLGCLILVVSSDGPNFNLAAVFPGIEINLG